MRQAMQDHPRRTGHSGEFWQNVVHWRRGWQTTPDFCLENPMSSMKRQKDMTLEDEPPRSEGVQFSTGEEQRVITNSSRKNEVAGPKRKWCSVVDVSASVEQTPQETVKDRGVWRAAVRGITEWNHSPGITDFTLNDNNKLCSNNSLFTKTGDGPDLTQWAVVCQHLIWSILAFLHTGILTIPVPT